MSEKRITYVNSEGGVSVIVPADCGLTIEEIAAKDVPKGAPYKIVSIDEIPSDRSFRNAWETDGSKIAVNMEKAREIQKNRVREERRPLLEALDIEYMKAFEVGDAKRVAETAQEKQILRDATESPLFAEAQTPEELKMVTIEAIKRKARGI